MNKELCEDLRKKIMGRVDKLESALGLDISVRGVQLKSRPIREVQQQLFESYKRLPKEERLRTQQHTANYMQGILLIACRAYYYELAPISYKEFDDLGHLYDCMLGMQTRRACKNNSSDRVYLIMSILENYERKLVNAIQSDAYRLLRLIIVLLTVGDLPHVSSLALVISRQIELDKGLVAKKESIRESMSRVGNKTREIKENKSRIRVGDRTPIQQGYNMGDNTPKYNNLNMRKEVTNSHPFNSQPNGMGNTMGNSKPRQPINRNLNSQEVNRPINNQQNNRPINNQQFNNQRSDFNSTNNRPVNNQQGMSSSFSNIVGSVNNEQNPSVKDSRFNGQGNNTQEPRTGNPLMGNRNNRQTDVDSARSNHFNLN